MIKKIYNLCNIIILKENLGTIKDMIHKEIKN